MSKVGIITFRLVLSFAVVVGEDANNGRDFGILLTIKHFTGGCRCWRPRQQQRRSGIPEEIDDVLAFDTTLFAFHVIMTANLARNFLVEQLTPRYGEGEAKAIARIVFEDAFDHGRSFDESRFEEILARLVAGEPVQYVLGETDFFGLKFKVNPAVLIPRQETEELVAWVLEYLKDFPPTNAPRLLDIGLGSGCIGITLKKKMPNLQLFGLEKSPAALAIATENAAQILPPASTLNPQPSTFFQVDILNRSDWALFTQMDVVVSNPPYIPHSEKTLVPEHVLAHEPPLALFVDDPDPLLFYRTIADFSLEKLRPGGMLFFECNEFNAAEVVEILRQKGFKNLELRKDLAGAERMVKAVFEQ